MRHEPSPLHAVGSIASTELAAATQAALAAVTGGDEQADVVDAVLDVLNGHVDGLYAAALALEHGRLWILRARGYTMIPDGLAAEEGIVGRVVSTQKAQFAPDVSRDQDFVAAAHGVTSELALPLVVDDELIGVLNLETLRALPHDAPQLVQPLADALAPAVARLRGATGLDVSAITRFFVYVGSLRDPRQIAEITARALARALQLDSCQVVLVEDGRPSDAVAWSAGDPVVPTIGASAVRQLQGDIDLGAVFRLVDLERDPIPELEAAGVRSAVVMPLRANGVELGLIVGCSRDLLRYEQKQAETAALVAAHAAASIESALTLSRERTSALTDSLTGLLNRRGFHEELDAELDAHRDDRLPVSLVVLDLDEFKEINDRAGHEFGDALLREIGVVLPAIGPSHGRPARLGGDEFVLMAPGVEADDAVDLAERMREGLVRGLADAGFPVHVSLGVATYPYDGGSGAQLLRAADQALYEAKATGKNRVVGFRDVVSRRAGGERASADDRRRTARADAVSLPDVLEAASAIVSQATSADVIDRLVKAAVFVAGGTASVVSRIDGERLVDVSRHSLRDIDLGDEVAYLLADFPVTQEVLERQEPRSISFLDEDLDRAEAFVLRELRMNCVLLVPLVVAGVSHGLVEVYDMRLRRFGDDCTAAVEFLATVAARRLEDLGALEQQPRRRLPLFRLPAAS